MSEGRITPEEFAQLMALSDSDPERRRAEGTAEFAGMKAMLAAFESEAVTSAGDDAAIRGELARRLASQLPSPAAGRAAPPLPRAAKTQRGNSGGWLAALFGPVGARAAAFAVLLVVAALGVWTMKRGPHEDVIRGEHAGTFAITATPGSGTLDLTWPAVSGADGYRAILLGADLGEISRIDLGNATTWTLRHDSLPAGLASGAAISVEVQALQKGVELSSTPARAIRLP